MVQHLTISQKILRTLYKCEDGASWRQLAGWDNKNSPSSIYRTLNKMRRLGLVYKIAMGKNKKYYITKEGLNEIQKEKEKERRVLAADEIVLGEH